MRSHNCMLQLVTCGYKLVEESEQFVDLLLGKVCVVSGVFDFECVEVLSFAGHDVWERVETGITYGDADGMVAFFV